MSLDFGLLGIKPAPNGMLPENAPGTALFAAQMQKRAQDINLFNVQESIKARQAELAEQQRANIAQELDRAQGRQVQREELQFKRLKHHDDVGLRLKTFDLMERRLNFDISKEEFDQELASKEYNLAEKKFARSIIDQDRNFMLKERQTDANIDYNNRLAQVAEMRLAGEIDKEARIKADQARLSMALQEDGMEGYLQELTTINPAEAVKGFQSYAKTKKELGMLTTGYSREESQVEAASILKTAIDGGAKSDTIEDQNAKNAFDMKLGSWLADKQGQPLPEDPDEARLIIDITRNNTESLLAMELREQPDTKQSQEFVTDFFGKGSDIDRRTQEHLEDIEASDPFQAQLNAMKQNPEQREEMALAGDLKGRYNKMNSKQKDVIHERASFAEENMKAFEQIAKDFNPDLFSYEAQFDSYVGEIASKAKIADTDDILAIYEKTGLFGEMGRWLTNYAKQKSGAAVSEPEFKRLMKQTLGGDISAEAARINLSYMMKRAVNEINEARRMTGQSVIKMPQFVLDTDRQFSALRRQKALKESGIVTSVKEEALTYEGGLEAAMRDL